jgi:hypothetical protein
MTTTAAIEAVHRLVSMTNAVAASRALHVVAELGAADAIGCDDEVPIATVAERAGCNADALHRVLRLLEVHGVFRSDGGCWSHTPSSELLRSDHPTSVRAYARMIGQPSSWDALTELATCVRTGQPAPFLTAAGGSFGYLERHPDELRVFDAAMTAKAHADIAAILATIDFGPYATVADIGGGRGHLLRAITAAHPAIQGILFDLPHVLAPLQPELGGAVTLHAGDFFADPLPAADLSLLMHVIHDWDDADAARILAAVARRAAPASTLMILEWILPDRPIDDTAHVLDVMMLAVTGGRERTAAEYTALLATAGYVVRGIRPIEGPMAVIEAVRR